MAAILACGRLLVFWLHASGSAIWSGAESNVQPAPLTRSRFSYTIIVDLPGLLSPGPWKYRNPPLGQGFISNMATSTQMRIPILDLSAQHKQIGGEIETAVRAVLNDQKFILGPDVRALE